MVDADITSTSATPPTWNDASGGNDDMNAFVDDSFDVISFKDGNFGGSHG